MTTPSYTTDLTSGEINDCDSSTPTGVELTGHTTGGSIVEGDTDYFIEGSGCYSAPTGTKAGLCSIAFDSGSSQTINAGDCIFVWHVFLAGNAIDTIANGGLRVFAGDDEDNYKGWYTGGNDFGRNPFGGWQNFAVDPRNTQDHLEGTQTIWQFFGVGCKTTSVISKGNLHAMDVLRIGRGDFIVEYGETADYATFAGMAGANDATSTRWGLFQAEGAGYLWKGLISLGTASNAVDFRDSNRNITIDDCPVTYAAFNRIEVNNASSNVEWTGVNITALNASGMSIGQFEMIADATVTFTTCVFTDMSTFIFDSNATLDAVTFRRCALVTQAGGDFDNCIFDEATGAVALLVDNPDNIDNCSFVSDGTGHAIELGSACAGNSYTLTDFFVSGYATSDGSTGNEVIYNNSGGTVTINVDGGSGVSALSIRGGNVTLVANYSFTVTGLESGTEVTIVTSGTSTVLHHTESASTSDGDGKYQITYSHGGGAIVDVLIHHIDYKPDISNIYGLTLPGSNSSAKVNMFVDENYENP